MELQKTDILTLTEEKGGNMLELIGTRKNFLNRSLIAQALQPTINKPHLLKLKFLLGKRYYHSSREADSEWEKKSLAATQRVRL